jgi:uncharacterized membrane protein (UPF0127 family)
VSNPKSGYICAMNPPVLRILLLVVLTALAPGGAALAETGLASFETDRLVIETAEGTRHDIRIELATTPHQQQQGLMFRRDMAADAGMLFVYSSVGMLSMWMKNTVIPLDMLFIADGGRIVKIVERTIPLSLKTISSDRPVRGVLEVNGGTVARLGIRRGDRVLYGAFESGS